MPIGQAGGDAGPGAVTRDPQAEAEADADGAARVAAATAPTVPVDQAAAAR
jgi:hypothetical protein